jgi:hypothetical protein
MEYFEGLRIEANDVPRASEARKTIVILAAISSGPLPKAGDIIYFEIAKELREIRLIPKFIFIYLVLCLLSLPSSVRTIERVSRTSL